MNATVKGSDMIPVKVEQLVLSNIGFVVLLKAADGSRTLPIVIGKAEAHAIAFGMSENKSPRPLTHDLLKNLLDLLQWRLLSIEVCDLRDGTFYGRLILEKDGSRMQMDCRPSDAVALAVRFGCPIFVAESVMEQAGRHVETDTDAGGGGKKAPKPKKRLSPLETLNKELARAIKEERYEDAARLRDDITHLKNMEKGK